ncbi:hypothetical protein pneo_cds_766 [Pandoravirus neocaledonia]|uniref:Uncharacterized protein n=1 Tax=Pandoravirus neocaledonia TaxID=2107708 RepID=A0A2U7UD59_9VIRU|nr:hypothetical protein pneo_cds_766 [Pandoravirus neocaledonia]AVK76373.1 hypothetical protein pneo_cds_766 [Pandoravirus neocaledonia]
MVRASGREPLTLPKKSRTIRMTSASDTFGVSPVDSWTQEHIPIQAAWSTVSQCRNAPETYWRSLKEATRP